MIGGFSFVYRSGDDSRFPTFFYVEQVVEPHDTKRWWRKNCVPCFNNCEGVQDRKV
ncbi:hypothetical protein [Bacillus phage CP-51]|uniref:Uncharacterized protein n=1 Tax=Bacillus phage CP-51 TaxID=1391188 RepID=A0A068EPB2_9CAUD|nr:hypothetical protein OZ73_gp094 [Bacillus phage CP-51]AID50529.1 hypothetical protein [Bacillus phage CP-51]